MHDAKQRRAQRRVQGQGSDAGGTRGETGDEDRAGIPLHPVLLAQ